MHFDWWMIAWCVIAIPLVSVVDGGFLGLMAGSFFGKPEIGLVAGIALTAMLLYGQILVLS